MFYGFFARVVLDVYRLIIFVPRGDRFLFEMYFIFCLINCFSSI